MSGSTITPRPPGTIITPGQPAQASNVFRSAALLPDSNLRMLIGDLKHAPLPQVINREGVLLFVDVSKFSYFGSKNDAKEITRFIQETVWEPLMKILLAHGAEMISFEGDGMVIFFEGKEGIGRCKAASAEMLARLPRICEEFKGKGLGIEKEEYAPSFSGAALWSKLTEMRVGNDIIYLVDDRIRALEKDVGEKEVLLEVEGRRETVTAGKARSDGELAVAIATVKRIVLLDEAKSLLSGIRNGEGMLKAYIPQFATDNMDADGNLRQVYDRMGVMFGRVYGLLKGNDSEKIERIGGFSQGLDKTLASFGGRTVIFTGKSFIAVFEDGKAFRKAGILASNETMENALKAKADVQIGKSLGMTMKTIIGIEGVDAFYSVLGHSVNTSARLMEYLWKKALAGGIAAKGNMGGYAVLEEFMRGSDYTYAMRDEDVPLKNIGKKTIVVMPSLAQEGKAVLVGREKELSKVGAKLEAMSAVMVSGADGIGKSAVISGVPGSAVGECPYRREPFGAILMIGAELEKKTELSKAQLEALNEMRDLAAGKDEMDSSARSARFKEKAIAFLSTIDGKVLVFDNCRHMDPDSRRMLFEIAERAGKKVVFEADEELWAGAAEMDGGAATHKVPQLEKAASMEMLAVELAKRNLAPPDQKEFSALADTGNPRVIRDVVREGARLGYFSQNENKTILSETGKANFKGLMGKTELERRKDIVLSQQEYDREVLMRLHAAGKALSLKELVGIMSLSFNDKIVTLKRRKTNELESMRSVKKLEADGLLETKEGKIWFADEVAINATGELWPKDDSQLFHGNIAAHLAETYGIKIFEMQKKEAVSRAAEIREITDHLALSNSHFEASKWAARCAEVHEKISPWSAYDYYEGAWKAFDNYAKTSTEKKVHEKAIEFMPILKSSALLCRSLIETGNADELIRLMDEQLKIPRGEATRNLVLRNKAKLCMRLRKYNLALEAAEASKNRVNNRETTMIEAVSLAGLGRMKEAAEKRKELGNITEEELKDGEMAIKLFITSFHIEYGSKNYAEALGIANQGLAKAEENCDFQRQGIFCEYIAMAKEGLGMKEESEKAYDEAAEVFKKGWLFENLALNRANAAALYADAGRPGDADRALLEAMDVAKKHPAKVAPATVATLYTSYFYSGLKHAPFDEKEAWARQSEAYSMCQKTNAKAENPVGWQEFLVNTGIYYIKSAEKMADAREKWGCLFQAVCSLGAAKSFGGKAGLPEHAEIAEKLAFCQTELATLQERVNYLRPKA